MTISAKVVLDSISPAGIRLTTVQLRYPKFIHGELMTHRVFSRNASSSRAIPVERMIQDVIDDPIYPSHWGKNQAGMSAREEHSERVPVYGWGGGTDRDRKSAWDLARHNAVQAAKSFAQAGYHKQIANRIIEPFCHINVVVTATEWSNFFALRCHPDAQPEMRLLAEAIRTAMDASVPKQKGLGDWHLPYVSLDEWTALGKTCLDEDHRRNTGVRVSVARCARVSYLTQEGKTPSIGDDLTLYDRLVGSVPLHASPAEHQATPDEWSKEYTEYPGVEHGWTQPELHGNFRGWVQYRKTLKGECQ